MSFEIKVAERAGTRLLIQLAGESGDGKTYTALLLAYGLADSNANDVVGICTENRRMQLYSSILPNQAKFRTIEFYAPFSPDRYIQAIDAACAAGAKVIVLDTVSYEWAGIGGCLEIAEKLKGPQAQKASKTAHRKFMNHLIQCPAHIIVCTRAKEKFDWTDPNKPKRLGVGPIQEAEFGFECTVSLLMRDRGERQEILKCPGELMPIMGRGNGFIGVDEGKALLAWVNGGAKLDPAVESARGTLQNVAEQGVEALREVWGKTPKAIQKALGQEFLAATKASAEAYDKQRAEGVQAGVSDRSADALNAAAQEIAGTVETRPDSAAAGVQETSSNMAPAAEAPPAGNNFF